jgi:hypothetical protein
VNNYASGNGHTGVASDYRDSTAKGPGLRLQDGNKATEAVIFGIACLNCHGAPNWGTIHGTSQEFSRPAPYSNTRQSYRFLNGGSQRYYVDNGWNVTTTTCYTLGTADDWGSCVKHGSSPVDHTKVLVRQDSKGPLRVIIGRGFSPS